MNLDNEPYKPERSDPFDDAAKLLPVPLVGEEVELVTTAARAMRLLAEFPKHKQVGEWREEINRLRAANPGLYDSARSVAVVAFPDQPMNFNRPAEQLRLV